MQTRPDILFQCFELMSKINSATVEDLVRPNKVSKQAKEKKIILQFPKQEDIENVRFVTCHDASYANLENGGSQGAHVIFLVDNNGNAALISWQSKRISSVVLQLMIRRYYIQTRTIWHMKKVLYNYV